MTRRIVHEWGEIGFGEDPEDPRTIPRREAHRIADVAAASPLAGKDGRGVVRLERKALRTRGVVGVIAADGCALEILPKIDVSGEGGVAAQNAGIRRRLVHMLAVALDLNVETGQITELDWQRETLLEILIRIFSEKLADALRQGMPRGYVGHEEDLATLRGSLNVTRQFTRHAVNPSRLACHFDVFTDDVALNRVMKAAVLHLSRISRSLVNQRRLRELAFVYAEVADVPVSDLRVEEVTIDRTNKRWQDLLSMATLLLKDRFQTTTGGASIGMSLLFEMNVRFEEYVGRLIGRAVTGFGYRVSRQCGRLYCLTEEETGRQLFQTRPDIVIWRNGEVIHVVDTKWKRISSRVDDAKQGVSQSDVYQMMAYGQLYRPSRLTLLYPHHHGLDNGEGIHTRYQITGHDVFFETASFDVGDGKDVVARLRRLLFQPPGHPLQTG